MSAEGTSTDSTLAPKQMVTLKDKSDDDRLRTTNRIQSAIQECINFKQLVNVQQAVANPFVDRDKPVRPVNEDEVRPVASISGNAAIAKQN